MSPGPARYDLRMIRRLLASATLLLAACTPAPGPAPVVLPSAERSVAAAASAAPSPIKIEAPTSAKLEVGQVQPLLVAATYADGRRDLGVSFTSSDASVATVDDIGLVTGVAPGRATIRATSDLDGAVFAEAQVTVR